MKVIVYSKADGSVHVVGPAEGARLAKSIKLNDGTVVRVNKPVPADNVFRKWPIDGATPEWAETEDEFISRIREKDVPKDAVRVLVMDRSQLPDRSSRAKWRLGTSGIET